MRLEDIQNSEGYPHLERYVNGGTRTYSPFSSHIEIAPQYRPTGDTQSFDVPLVRLPKHKAHLFLDDPTPELHDYYVQDDHVLFAVYPEIWMDGTVSYMDELRGYEQAAYVCVQPTASSRTVITKAGELPQHYLKMHCPRRISRFQRRYRAASVEQSVLVSRELASIQLDSFAYLPKTIGVYYGTREEGWGYCVREYVPRPFIQDSRKMIPFFSLYGADMRAPDDLPLLVQWIQHLGADPETFVMEKLIAPLIQGWVHVNRETGIILAPHGQNVLVEIDSQMQPKRMVHRDFIVYIDARRRDQKGLPPINSLAHRLLQTAQQRHEVYSLIYDAFMGHHLFEYLAQVIERYFDVPSYRIQAAVRERMKLYFPEQANYFSNRTYYYSNELQADNSSKLIDTLKPPVWR